MVVKNIHVFVLDFLFLPFLLIYKFLTSLWQFLSVWLHVLDFWWNVYIALTTTQDLLPVIPRNIKCLSHFQWTFDNTVQEYLRCLLIPQVPFCLLGAPPLSKEKRLTGFNLCSNLWKGLNPNYGNDEEWKPQTPSSKLASFTAIPCFILWHLMVNHEVRSQLGSYIFARCDFAHLCVARETHFSSAWESQPSKTTSNATYFTSFQVSDQSLESLVWSKNILLCGLNSPGKVIRK